MPSKALKPCSYPGCPNLVEGGRCELHKNESEFKRDPAVQRLYDRKWQARRRVQLSAHPWCEVCLSKGIYTPATDVHHVSPHRGDKELFISSPLMSLCHACHSEITSREVRGMPFESFKEGECRARVVNHGKLNPNTGNPGQEGANAS